MGILKLPVILIVLFVALNHLEGGGKSTESVTSHQIEKRKCGTATCATQRLANFLAPSGNKLDAIFSPTKMRSNTYGKRKKVEILKREP